MNFDFIGKNIIRFPQIDSTNKYIKKNLDKLENGTLVTAELQYAGRGRLGSDWQADYGMLPFSFLIRDMENPTQAAILTPIAVCRALEQLYDINIYIKWSNDIIAYDKKVCGILCESIIFDGKINIICGVGINLHQNQAFFDNNTLPHAASMLTLTGKSISKDIVLDKMILNLKEVFSTGFKSLKEEYKLRSATLGKVVKLQKSNKEIIAKAIDIDNDGLLICKKDGTVFSVNSGEVHVRGIYGYID